MWYAPENSQGHVNESLQNLLSLNRSIESAKIAIAELIGDLIIEDALLLTQLKQAFKGMGSGFNENAVMRKKFENPFKKPLKDSNQKNNVDLEKIKKTIQILFKNVYMEGLKTSDLVPDFYGQAILRDLTTAGKTIEDLSTQTDKKSIAKELEQVCKILESIQEIIREIQNDFKDFHKDF